MMTTTEILSIVHSQDRVVTSAPLGDIVVKAGDVEQFNFWQAVGYMRCDRKFSSASGSRKRRMFSTT